MTGTLCHGWAHEASGTADWVFWNADLGWFVLGDMKTIKGDGIAWIEKDGAKREHLWQLSCYWHALIETDPETAALS
jgi:hypothetical protein